MTESWSAARATEAWAAARGIPCVFTAETGSTNDDAKATTDPAAEWIAVTAHQKRGRGRGANAWSDLGRGAVLLSTWIHQTTLAPQAVTAPRIGLALHRAVTRAWPALPWGLKAPNDLFLAERKTAGLLIEVTGSSERHRLIVGLGLNVLSKPPLDTATCLTEHLGRAPTADEWTAFCDAWRRELRSCLVEIARPTLGPEVRRDLRLALNARPGRAFDVSEVTPQGDLAHAGGIVRWTDL